MDITQEILQYFVGPLNLNRQTKQATTVLGTSLLLDENEFDALDMLVYRESIPFSFDQLYSTICEASDHPVSRDAAKTDLFHLIEQVGIAGHGFMWIEYSQDSEYTFHTRWAHQYG